MQADLWQLFDLSELAQVGLDQFMSDTLDRCAVWFRASAASIFLAEEVGVYRLFAQAGTQSTVNPDARVHAGQGIAGLALLDGSARLVGDPSQDPFLSRMGIRKRPHIASSMVVPLREPSGVNVGVLNLSRGHDKPPFRDEDLEQAQALASFLSLAISNAKLVDRLHDKVRELRQSNHTVRAVLDAVPGAVLVYRRDGTLDQASHKAAGLPKPLPVELEQALEQARSNPGADAVRVEETHSERTWLVESTPVQEGGCVVSVRETTELDRAHREYARVKRLAEIGQMTAAIAHEIRNPLTGIRAAGQMVRQHPDMAVELGGIVEQEALKLNSLCDEFLDFAKPVKLKLEPTDVAEVCERVVRLCQPNFEAAAVTLELICPSQPTLVQADARRLEQVVRNLALNAIQACRPGGAVRIEVLERGLRVTDNGKGMDEQTLARLYSPFFTTKCNGTGLGLSNVRKILDAHGARIHVRSTPGAGTTFDVEWGANRE